MHSNPPLPVPGSTTAYGRAAPNVGQPVPSSTYTACEYPACTNPAIMMPGYHRSCADHITHLLQQSVSEYLNRRVPIDPTTRSTLLKLLASLQEYAKHA